MKPKVCIIILTYNHLKETIDTIDCFKEQDYENINIVIVDNGSIDNTTEYIKKKYPGIYLIENKTNLGWATGNNIGINYALKGNADYILLANNDIFFDDSNLISTLVNNMEEFPKENNVRVLGTRQYSFFEKEKLLTNGIFYFNNCVKKNNEFNTFRNQNKINFPQHFKKVDSVIGAFVLIKKELFTEIGLIDDGFYFTWEDTDFCYRAWQKGFTCVINEGLKIYHKVSTSCKKKSAFLTYYLVRNQYLFLKKHKNTIHTPLYYFSTFYYKFLRKIFGIILFPSQLNDSTFKVLKAAFRGFFDAVLFNKKGKVY